MTDDLAPIVLFVYNRLDHTQRTVQALKNNTLADQSVLIIFSDGPKKLADLEYVSKVREYISQLTGFAKVVVRERETNYGLARSIVEGVTEVIKIYGKVIVLEDDLITNSLFLKYMNEGLRIYKDIPNVYSVSGYSYLKNEIPGLDTYFLKLTSSWSWATWKDRWVQYDTCCKGWEVLKSNSKLRKSFDYEFSYPYYRLLKRQLKDAKINSWAIKWYWTVFKNNGLTLYPSVSLVENVGFDGSGEHCSYKQKNAQIVQQINKYENMKYEEKVEEQTVIRNRVAKDLHKELGLGGKMQIIKDMIG